MPQLSSVTSPAIATVAECRSSCRAGAGERRTEDRSSLFVDHELTRPPHAFAERRGAGHVAGREARRRGRRGPVRAPARAVSPTAQTWDP